MGCGSDNVANDLLDGLIAGKDFNVDLPDLTKPEFQLPPQTGDIWTNVPPRLTNKDLTTGAVGGQGTFDVLMTALGEHIKVEYDRGRITGDQYAKAYIALTEGAMANATQYLLQKDQSYWQAITAQLQAQQAQVQLVTARVEMESAKARLAVLALEARNQEATYALTKIRLANEDMQYCISKFNLENILPQQKLLIIEQVRSATAEADNAVIQGDILTENLKGAVKQNTLLDAEISNIPLKKDALTKQNSLLQSQIEMAPTQKKLLEEQVEVQRAQTMDTRSDGTVIVGQVGKQKDLYSQQITSYKRDAEVKAGKLFLDSWTVMKTIDEGLAPPTSFQNTNLDKILKTIQTNNNIS